jgi:hypothetical protein
MTKVTTSTGRASPGGIVKETRAWVTTRYALSMFQIPAEGTLITDGTSVRFVSNEKGEVFSFDIASTKVKFARLDGRIRFKSDGARFHIWFRHPLNKGNLVLLRSWRTSRTWKAALGTATS